MAVLTPPLPAGPVSPSIAPVQAVSALPEPDDEFYRLSVKQYHAMVEAGILTEDDPVELLEGLLVKKMPKHSPHRLAKILARDAFLKLVPEQNWYVDDQEPVTTGDSEPEPDIYVIRGQPRDYSEQHPGPHDVGLLMEIADPSIYRDRGGKKRIYARANVPVYWIVNLVDHQIEVYTDPTGPTESPDYRQRQDYKTGDSIPVVLDGQEIGRIAVNDILPRS